MIMLGLSIVCCVVLLLFDLRKKSNASVKKESIPKMLLYVIATALLIFCMEHVGIVVSVAVYIFCITFFCPSRSIYFSAFFVVNQIVISCNIILSYNLF